MRKRREPWAGGQGEHPGQERCRGPGDKSQVETSFLETRLQPEEGSVSVTGAGDQVPTWGKMMIIQGSAMSSVFIVIKYKH